MRTILTILLSSGLVIAQNAPQCATDCLAQNIPEAGCAVDDISCQCAAGFQEKLFFLALPCFTTSCAPSDFLQAKNAFGARCRASSGAPSVVESATSVAVEESTTTTTSTTTTSTTQEPRTMTTSTIEVATSSPTDEAVQASTAATLQTTLQTTTRPDRTTLATPNASTGNEQPTEMGESAESTDASGGDLDSGAKAGIGVGVSFGVIGAMCFGATLWLRRRNRGSQDTSSQGDLYQEKELHIGPTLPTELVEMNGLREPAEVEGQMGATEIDGRLAPQEMPA